jgi:hypothetical protein
MIVFECIYKPMMPANSFGQSFAVDTDAPKGELWSKSSKTERNESSSFLLSLPSVSAKETDLAVQPDKIHLVPNDENTFLKENLVMELGYELFKKRTLVMPLIKLRKHGSRN